MTAPTRSVLIYDADCGFCTRSALFLADRFDGSATIAAWQAVDLDVVGLTPDDVGEASWWIDADGEAHRGAQAIALGLAAGRQPWSLIGRLLAAPPLRWLADLVYPLVVRHRHRLPGATDACAVPDRQARGD